MTDEGIVQLMYEHFTGLFPKSCPNCGRYFVTLKQYILNTRRIGETISYDAAFGDWEPTNPLGTFAFANCRCGNTLALSTYELPLPKVHLMLRWIKLERERRNMTSEQLISYVGDEVRRRALAE